MPSRCIIRYTFVWGHYLLCSANHLNGLGELFTAKLVYYLCPFMRVVDSAFIPPIWYGFSIYCMRLLEMEDVRETLPLLA